MKKIYSAALAACIQLSAVSTYAQEYNLDDDVVIVVTKRPKLASMVGSAFSRIDSEEIQRSQSVSLTQALSTIPGVMAQEYGGRGSYAQFSIRGNTAAHTLYLLDGIRINTQGAADAKTFLSYASTSGLGSIEVARGPQSALYGADGIGGVVSMESERGKGKPSIILTSELGSFSTFRERMGSQGEIDKLAYSLSYEREDTANNLPHNDFGSNRYALRLDTDLSQDLSLRLNFRGHASEYQDNGITYQGLEKAESNLVAALEKEKKLGELKSRFVSMASHEFRTPLSTILSSISLVDRYEGAEEREKRNKHIDRIKSSVKNLTEILNDFLSLEKLEAGKVEVNPTSFDLKQFCEETAEELQIVVKNGQQIVYRHIQGDPEITADKQLLRNIMINLLNNAIKYSKPNGIIEFSSDTSATVSLEIKDHGIGIPDEDQKQLFERFFRAGNVTTIQGTGLGLNIVRRYTKLLNGEINFTSKLDEGTTFTITFPK